MKVRYKMTDEELYEDMESSRDFIKRVTRQGSFLKDAMFICKECNGTGRIKTYYDDLVSAPPSILSRCKKCKGDGVLDWIENIVGKKAYRIVPGFYIQDMDEYGNPVGLMRKL